MLKEKLYNGRNELFALITIVLYSAMVFMYDADDSKVILIYLTYGLLAVTLITRMKGIKMYPESISLFAYLGFGVLSLVWSQDRNLSITRIKGVFLLLVLLILLSSYLIKIEKPIQLLFAIAVGGVALSVYIFSVYGISGVISSLTQSGNRLGSGINNVNAIAHGLVAGTISMLTLGFFYNRKLLFFLIPLVLCCLAAGSRTATLSLIAGVLLIIYFYIKSINNESTRVSRAIIVVIIIIAIWAILRNLPGVRDVIIRFENSISILTGKGSHLKESSTETRLDYINKGWQQFLKSPIWGNGIGCAGYAINEEHYVTYLHNNYMEMLASGGIIGFLLFYTPYFMLLNTFRKRIFVLHEKNPLVFVSFTLIIVKLIAHFGTVVYYSKIEFLLLVFWLAVANTKIEALPKKTEEQEQAAENEQG